MAQSEFSTITVNLTASGTIVAGQSTLLTSQLTTAQQASRVAAYGSVQEIKDLGLADTHPSVQYAETYFGQPNRAEFLYLGRRTPGVAQVDTLTIATADAGTWTMTIDGTVYSYIASGADTVQTIAEGLRAQILAAAGPYNLSAVTTGVFTVTAQMPGSGFMNGGVVVPGAGAGTFANTTANTAAEDIGDCIAACVAEDPESWYYVSVDTRDGLELLDAQVQVNLAKKFAIYQSSDPDAKTASANDIKALADLNYPNCLVMYTETANQYMDAAVAGYAAAQDLDADEGMFTLNAKTFVGVKADKLTSAERAFLKSNGANYYITEKGVDSLIPGQAVNGEFADVQISIDWASVRLQEAFHSLVTSQPKKIPGTLSGIAQVQNALQAVMTQGVDAGHFLTGTVRPMDLSNFDRNTRQISATCDATIQGAVHTLAITFNVQE